MAIRVALHHKTVYQYDRLVKLSPHIIRLRPAPHSRTPVLSYSLKIEPGEHFLNWQQDPHSNYLARLVFPGAVGQLSIEVDIVAQLVVYNPFDFFLEPDAEQFPFTYEPWLKKELLPYLETEAVGPLLGEFLGTVDREKRRTMDFLVGLNQRLQREIRYVIRMEPGVQTPEETLGKLSGSCRDSAWLQVQILRNLGLAARFVSGYLIQLKPDEKPLEGPEGAAQDFTDLHAWAEVYLPGAGWVGLDATSGLLTAEGHIPVAATPDPLSAAPVTGLVDPCEVEFHHEMTVTRIHEDPRVTKPYTEKQWAAVEALGERIDETLKANDVRLTMGGEPTFVSIDDRDGEEWNFAAMGPHKRALAGDLFLRLRERFAKGPLLHYGQGKWYPGEQLPRWALTCYWRKDGVPLWHDARLIADEQTRYNYTAADAQRFSETLAHELEVPSGYCLPAFEDPLYYIHREGRLPVNVNPVDSKLEDPEERERLRRVFTRGLDQPVGYVLPVERAWGRYGPEWQSGMWMLRGKALFLVPGDSPVGFRLPLAALPWADPKDLPAIVEADPMAWRRPLERERQRANPPQRQREVGDAPPPMPRVGEPAGWVVRTAVCVEPRDGRMHVFMPPVATLEDYLDLLGAVERTAARLRIPVTIEGYTPPFDYRIEQIKVTPDPGVIEVNIHPSHDWKQLVENTTALYEEAKQARLSTEKFMLDGRHAGTGGGNHVVIGGPTPNDSPILRRPDLLRSLLGYWINHPSLSFLFSGMFIGPTSQAPRVDEARADNIYEMEIAFEQVPLPGEGYTPPWLVDRIFRHLLVDVTGNTHRSEFCIDKLFAPETATGRLGLLELRAFEMPPHAQMSLTQQLLLRGLIAWFWKEPYTVKPVRWGTQLHDRFLLPHFIEQDFGEVIHDLNVAGLGFEKDWFAPHMEFRFPVYGRVAHQSIEVEIRQAIEPWYVLGEEPGAMGTARYVDSSVERLQVKVRGLVEGRHVVACNGRRVPLQPTGTHGEAVGGVRYRAWQPGSCLHPTIGVHTPLVFDLVDTWTGRSIGGCTYHVAHPGGRSYTTFPVNANEAEARRVARFFEHGHTPGPMGAPVEERNAEFPFTLDLRRRG